MQTQLIKHRAETLITLLIKKTAESLRSLCSTTREQERGFSMTAQGQVKEGSKNGGVTMGEERGEREKGKILRF